MRMDEVVDDITRMKGSILYDGVRSLRVSAGHCLMSNSLTADV